VALAATPGSVLAPRDAREIRVSVRAIGFADLCGFTRLSRSLDEGALLSMVDGFESAARLVLPACGATVVKLLGDGVLFHAPEAGVAVDAAVALIDEARGDRALPPVRAAITVGQVVLRDGDCFGEVVNRASRLLDVAPASSVIGDRSAVMTCGGRPWVVLGKRDLRDYGPWETWAAVT
jgi:adenylate cyclase